MRTIKQEQYFPLIIAIHFILWWIDIALYNGSYEYNSKHIVGEVFSSWVITVFAANFLMATRARWVERIFGGLDKMYIVHRRAAVIAVVLLIFHFIIVPRDPVFTIGKPLGFYSMILIFLGVALSAIPVLKRKIRYNKWLNFHKLMGIFYILGIAHSLNVLTLTSELPLVRIYVYGMALIGVIAWFYKAFLYNIIHKKLDYTVSSLKHFDNDTTEVHLQPVSKKMAYDSGQFAFVGYDGLNRKEAHPFTISNHPIDDNLRLTIKSLGDYTANLQTSLKEGAKAKVQGPYGQFNFKKGKFKDQLWLAGGIGITPFLSFIRELGDDIKVTLVWSVKSLDQANYKTEIEQIAAKKSNLKFVVWDTDKKGYFTIDKLYKAATIKEHSIYICGPEVMRESYIQQLLEKGVSIKDVHYEEFSFR